LTSKERVYNALHKNPVDRVPVFMWYHPQTKNRLAKLLEIPEKYVSEVLGDDIKQTWVNNNHPMENVPIEQNGLYTDQWGIEWTRYGDFNQIQSYPLANASKEEIEDYSFPLDRMDELMGLMAPVISSKENYFIGCDISPCVFEMYWRLRGLENTMLDIISKESSCLNLFNKCTDFSIALAENAMNRYDLDWVWTGDDAGTQANMMMSPALWREIIKPGLKQIFDAIRAQNMIVAFHSCGAVRPIIGDLVEIGMDVLNPIQSTCPGMEALELKKEYGDKIAFMGGVDTQNLLPEGTSEEIYKATVTLIEGMTADGGGYILAASHTVPPETPDDNIFAMYEAAGISKTEIFDKAADIRNR
jgi:uroporphyrinogen decarboxylase